MLRDTLPVRSGEHEVSIGSAVASGSATLVCRREVLVNAAGRSTVYASGKCQVHAGENAHVIAREQATVYARDNAHVEAMGPEVKIFVIGGNPHCTGEGVVIELRADALQLTAEGS